MTDIRDPIEESAASTSIGKFEGPLSVTFCDDGVHVQLNEKFAFIDSTNQRWDVPKDTIVDGASIPRILWSLIGSPFTGKYVKASVIHDWHCDVRSRPWLNVHRMFYEAMVVSGVSGFFSKRLYAGVYMGGPRWTQTVSENVRLLAREGDRFAALHDDIFLITERVYKYEIQPEDLNKLEHFVKEDTSLTNIDQYSESHTIDLEESEILKKTKSVIGKSPISLA